MQKWFSILVLFFSLMACGQEKNIYRPLKHYDVQKAQEFKLDKSLKEISGIVFKENDQFLFGEQDEDGNVYQINPLNGESRLYNSIQQKGDFEDIAYVNKSFYLLRSDGEIFSFPSIAKFMTKDIKQFSSILPKAEYEGLCYNPETKSLYALTKYIPENNKQAFIYRLLIGVNDQLTLKEKIIIDSKKIEKQIGIKKLQLHPSAIAFNQVDKQWFILSSVNHLLLVLDEHWQLKDFTTLDSQQYPQPEGMTFDSKGNLWLASEARNTKYGRIYRIDRN